MKALALVAALCAPAQAAALECFTVNPEIMWQIAVDDAARTMPVYGRVSKPLGPVELGGVVALDMQQASFPAQFKGHALTRAGFTHAMDTTITVDLACVDPACSDFPYATPVMALLTETPRGWALRLGPCIDPLIEHPSPAERHRMRNCARDRCAKVEY